MELRHLRYLAVVEEGSLTTAGELRPHILAVGYGKANTSPILELFLAGIEELRAPIEHGGQK